MSLITETDYEALIKKYSIKLGDVNTNSTNNNSTNISEKDN